MRRDRFVRFCPCVFKGDDGGVAAQLQNRSVLRRP